MRGFNGDWSDSAGNELDFIGNDSYQRELTLADPAAPARWTSKWHLPTGLQWIAAATEPMPTLAWPTRMDCAGRCTEYLLNDDGAGQYSFHVDGTDPANPLLTVEKTPLAAEVFVRGLSQDWSEANPLRYTGNSTYEATLALTGLTAGDLDFKVASADWSTVDCGSNGSDIDLATAYVLNCAGAGNIVLNADPDRGLRLCP